jgi:serine protease Do
VTCAGLLLLLLGFLSAPGWAELALAAEAPRARTGAGASPLTELADRARTAVVHVRGVLRDGSARPDGDDGGRRGPGGSATVSVGSGFIVDKAGHVVTNEHVVRGTVDIRVRLHDGREMPACVVGSDEPADIAVLKIEPKGPVPVLPLGNSDAVRVGDVALAIGSPFGFSHSVTAGIVSAKDRVVDQAGDRAIVGEREEPYSFFIQTDASINLGNSGGPLVDARGAAIGVNAAFWGGSQPAQGVGFAIPINVVKMLLPRLRASGEAPRSFLGVESQPLTADLVTALRLPSIRGALVAFVEPGSAAAASGLEPGDVVTSWDGHPLVTRDDFRIFAQLTPPGKRVKVSLLRDGKAAERTITTRPATNAVRPPHPSDCRTQPRLPPLAEGFDAEDVPAARAKDLPGGKGVHVTRVHGGAAREADLQENDIVLRVGRKVVSSAAALRRALDEWSAKTPVPLLLRRHGYDFWTALPRR